LAKFPYVADIWTRYFDKVLKDVDIFCSSRKSSQNVFELNACSNNVDPESATDNIFLQYLHEIDILIRRGIRNIESIHPSHIHSVSSDASSSSTAHQTSSSTSSDSEVKFTSSALRVRLLQLQLCIAETTESIHELKTKRNAMINTCDTYSQSPTHWSRYIRSLVMCEAYLQNIFNDSQFQPQLYFSQDELQLRQLPVQCQSNQIAELVLQVVQCFYKIFLFHSQMHINRTSQQTNQLQDTLQDILRDTKRNMTRRFSTIFSISSISALIAGSKLMKSILACDSSSSTLHINQPSASASSASSASSSASAAATAFASYLHPNANIFSNLMSLLDKGCQFLSVAGLQYHESNLQLVKKYFQFFVFVNDLLRSLHESDMTSSSTTTLSSTSSSSSSVIEFSPQESIMIFAKQFQILYPDISPDIFPLFQNIRMNIFSFSDSPNSEAGKISNSSSLPTLKTSSSSSVSTDFSDSDKTNVDSGNYSSNASSVYSNYISNAQHWIDLSNYILSMVQFTNHVHAFAATSSSSSSLSLSSKWSMNGNVNIVSDRSNNQSVVNANANANAIFRNMFNALSCIQSLFQFAISKLHPGISTAEQFVEQLTVHWVIRS
jgi:hypothetical protein